MSVNLNAERIVWIDVETTGIDANKEHLLQVACIVTDGNLVELDKGYEQKVYYSQENAKEMRFNADPYVQNMHDVTGLWKALPSGVKLEEMSNSLLSYIKGFVPDARTARLGGNSITLDRNFLHANVPDVLNHLHYRSYDITSISGFFELYVPGVGPFEKKLAHEALGDIQESIAEARHYAKSLQDGYPPF